MLQGYHSSKRPLQSQICLSLEILCLLNAPPVSPRKYWEWRRSRVVSPTPASQQRHSTFRQRAFYIPLYLASSCFPFHDQEHFSELCTKYTVTCQILFLEKSSFNTHVRHFFTTLKEQFLYYKTIKNASSDIFKCVEYLTLSQWEFFFLRELCQSFFMAECEVVWIKYNTPTQNYFQIFKANFAILTFYKKKKKSFYYGCNSNPFLDSLSGYAV